MYDYAQLWIFYEDFSSGLVNRHRACGEVRTVLVDFDLPRGDNYLPHWKQLFRLHSNATSVHQTDIMRKISCHVEMDLRNCCWLDFDFNRKWNGLKCIILSSFFYLLSKYLVAWITLFLKALRFSLFTCTVYRIIAKILAEVKFRISCLYASSYSQHRQAKRIFQISPWKQKRHTAINMNLSNEKSNF